MIRGWIVLGVCAAVAAGFTFATSTSSEAAMALSGAKTNMSMVEQVARKRRPKAVCTQKLIFTCCTVPGGQEMCDIK